METRKMDKAAVKAFLNVFFMSFPPYLLKCNSYLYYNHGSIGLASARVVKFIFPDFDNSGTCMVMKSKIKL